MKRIAIIGAGAAGCFCAINLKRIAPQLAIDIYEGGAKALAKVAITGGGRCNLTNTFKEVKNLQQVYPRGDKLIKRAFARFDYNDCWEWFENEGVELTSQPDQCVFPASQDAMQIVNTLLDGLRNECVDIHLNHKVKSIEIHEDRKYAITFTNNRQILTDCVVVTTGGSPSIKGLQFLSSLNLKISSPLPSLFTLNMEGTWRSELMGTVVNDVVTTIVGTKFKASGPLLITHWGMSGPAILKLTSYAARHLADNGYKGSVAINWCNGCSEEDIRTEIETIKQKNSQKKLSSIYPKQFIARHWEYLLSKSGLSPDKRWNELGTKQTNKLITTLTNDIYAFNGKCRFKEEFVTCGGVALTNINMNTLEAKEHRNLYFAGEILDVDAVTGGFNLQAAWSMGYVVAESIRNSVSVQ